MLCPLAVVRPAGEAHSQQHVFQRRESRQKMVRLEDVANVSTAEFISLRLGKQGQIDRLGRIRFFRIESKDDVSAVGNKNACDHVQESRFARPTLALKCDLRLRCHGEIIHLDNSLLVPIESAKVCSVSSPRFSVV